MYRQLSFEHLAGLYSYVIEQEGGQKIQCNGIWVHERFHKRKIEGEFATLHREIEDEEMRHYRYFRMSVHKCTVLLTAVTTGRLQIAYIFILSFTKLFSRSIACAV
jgi:hypothetical protein